MGRNALDAFRCLLMQELHRIAKPNGKLVIRCPHGAMLDPDILCSRCEPISGRAHDCEIVDAEQTSASIQRWIAFLCTGIRPSIGTENLIPEKVNYTKITIQVTVMNKVQFLMASEPRKPL